MVMFQHIMALCRLLRCIIGNKLDTLSPCFETGVSNFVNLTFQVCSYVKKLKYIIYLYYSLQEHCPFNMNFSSQNAYIFTCSITDIFLNIFICNIDKHPEQFAVIYF